MKSILIVLGIFCCSSIFAQSDFDERLLVKFDEEKISELAEDHSSVLEYWTFYLDNSYEIVDAPVGKDFQSAPEIKIKNREKFNILSSGLNMSRNSNQVFRIKNSNQILVLFSNAEFTKMFNEYRSQSN